MHTYIALLRGINVGGRHKLPMRDLVTLLEGLGLKNVKTYIQSGNIVFQSERTDRPALAREISAAIEANHGFAPHTILLSRAELRAAMTINPYPEAEQEPKTLHLFFLDDVGDAGGIAVAGIAADGALDVLRAVKAASERFQLIDSVLYLHAPEGIGRSKLAAKLSSGWNVPVTARNSRTVTKIMEMAMAVA